MEGGVCCNAVFLFVSGVFLFDLQTDAEGAPITEYGSLRNQKR